MDKNKLRPMAWSVIDCNISRRFDVSLPFICLSTYLALCRGAMKRNILHSDCTGKWWTVGSIITDVSNNIGPVESKWLLNVWEDPTIRDNPFWIRVVRVRSVRTFVCSGTTLSVAWNRKRILARTLQLNNKIYSIASSKRGGGGKSNKHNLEKIS